MVAHADPKPEGGSLSADFSAGSQMGKRYVDADTGFEGLCTKPGKGSFALDGRALTVKEAKKLPSSD
jgi:hypothetical protein